MRFWESCEPSESMEALCSFPIPCCIACIHLTVLSCILYCELAAFSKDSHSSRSEAAPQWCQAQGIKSFPAFDSFRDHVYHKAKISVFVPCPKSYCRIKKRIRSGWSMRGKKNQPGSRPLKQSAQQKLWLLFSLQTLYLFVLYFMSKWHTHIHTNTRTKGSLRRGIW